MPYEETEISLSLPDPIDLRIQPRKLVPERSEAKALEKLHSFLSELDEVKILNSFFYSEAEIDFIKRLLNRLEIEYTFVKEDPNVVIDIPRFDPILLSKGAISTYYLEINRDDILSSLLEGFPVKYPKDILAEVPKDISFIDIIVDGGSEVYDIYMSVDGSHWEILWEDYYNLWGLKSPLASLIICSVGGWPWDSDISLIASSLLKLHNSTPDDGVAILVGDGVVRDEVYNRVMMLDELDAFNHISEVYLYHLRNEFSRSSKRIYYFGGLPSTFLKYLNVKNLKNIEWMLKTIPLRMKRSISLIEDSLHLYPIYLGGHE